MAYNYDDEFFTKIMRRLRTPAIGSGRATLFSSSGQSTSPVGLGAERDTGPSPIQMSKGGKVRGYTERWRKARGN